MWAAYKKGALASMGPPFDETTMEPAPFRAALEREIDANYDGAWILFAGTPQGNRPIGLVLAFWTHHNVLKAPFMIIGDMVWFPWASPRNRIAAAVRFFHEVRNSIPMVEYARPKDKAFFVVMMRHGIMNQVGTSMNVYPGEPASVYETRRNT